MMNDSTLGEIVECTVYDGSR